MPLWDNLSSDPRMLDSSSTVADSMLLSGRSVVGGGSGGELTTEDLDSDVDEECDCGGR